MSALLDRVRGREEPPPTAADVREARRRHLEAEEAAQRERAEAQRKTEYEARQAKQLEMEARRKAAADEFCERRDVLRLELRNAEDARASLSVALDLSTVQGALQAARVLADQHAADRLVERCERALDQHTPRR